MPSSHERGRDMTRLKDYVMVAEAAQMLGVSENTLRIWADAGKVIVHRNPANGYRLFKRNELEVFLRKVERPTRHED
jgi:predicted site-specific integrase-resolvase